MPHSLFLYIYILFHRLAAISVYDPATMEVVSNALEEGGPTSINSSTSPALVIPFTVSRKQASVVKSSDNSGGFAYLSAGEASETLTAIIQVGSPPQPMNILFDTGSTLFWMVSAACSSRDCLGQPNFDPSKSSSYSRLASNKTLSQVYGDGSNVTCTVSGVDSISLGSSVIVPSQKFCEATKVFGINDIQGWSIYLYYNPLQLTCSTLTFRNCWSRSTQISICGTCRLYGNHSCEQNPQ